MGFGGPLDQERSGIVGAIGEDSYGINAPFTNETFAVSDVVRVQSELDGAAWLKEVVLGYKA